MKQVTLEEYTEALKVVRAYIAQIQEELGPPIKYSELANTLLDDLNVSQRVYNLLRFMKIDGLLPKEPKVYHLSEFSAFDLVKQRNFGKRSLTEIQELLASAGLKLKSDD